MPIEEHAQSEVESEFEERKMKELDINVSSKYCIISYESGVKMTLRSVLFGPPVLILNHCRYS